MSSGKTWTVVIVIVLVALAGWMWYSKMQSNEAANVPASGAKSSANGTGVQVTTQSSASAAASMSSSKDSSDAALQQDLNSIDTQSSSLDSDVSNSATPTQ